MNTIQEKINTQFQSLSDESSTEESTKKIESLISEAKKNLQASEKDLAMEKLQLFSENVKTLSDKIEGKETGLRAIPIIGDIVTALSPQTFDIEKVSSQVDSVFHSLGVAKVRLHNNLSTVQQYANSLDSSIATQKEILTALKTAIDSFEVGGDKKRERFLSRKKRERNALMASILMAESTQKRIDTYVDGSEVLVDSIESGESNARVAIDNALLESAAQRAMSDAISASAGLNSLTSSIGNMNSANNKKGMEQIVLLDSTSAINADDLIKQARELKATKELFEAHKSNREELDNQEEKKLKEAEDILNSIVDIEDAVVVEETIEI